MDRRALKAEFLFSRCGAALADAAVLDIRGLNLVTLKGLEQCPSLSVLYASHNKLTSLEGLEQCHQLWRVDVSGNKLEGLEPLPSLPCLGHLNLSSTTVGFQQLLALRAIPIIELETFDNPGLIIPGLTLVQNRLVLVHCLPRVWVLDGVYVTLAERAAAEAMFAKGDERLIAALRPFLGSAKRPAPWNSVDSIGPTQQRFLDALTAHPDRPDRVEGYQLRVYGSAYASDALLVNPYAAMYGSKSREVGKLRLPLLHARELLGSLSASDVTDIISLLVSTGEFSVPRDVLEDALTVLQTPLSSRAIHDLSRLPLSCLCALTSYLCEVMTDSGSVSSREVLNAVAAMDRGPAVHINPRLTVAALDDFQRKIWASFPRGGIIQAPNSDLHNALLDVSSQRFTSFPPSHTLLTPSGMARWTQRQPPSDSADSPHPTSTDIVASEAVDAVAYDSDPESRLRRADVARTMAGVDQLLSLHAGSASVSPSLSDAAALRARHAAVLLSRSPLFPPLVVKPGEKLPRRELIANYVKLYPLLHTAGLADVTGSRAGPPVSQPTPEPEPALKLVVAIESPPATDGFVLTGRSHGAASLSTSRGVASPSSRFPAPRPVSPLLSPGRRKDDAATQPLAVGGTTHAVRLHRRAEAINRSGVTASSGVVNIPIPGEFLQEIRAERLRKTRRMHLRKDGKVAISLPMAPLRAWVLNGTWDSNFVLASTDMIAAENRAAVLLGALPAADARNGAWTELNVVPYSVVGSRSAVVASTPDVQIGRGNVGRGYVVDGVFKVDEEPLAPQAAPYVPSSALVTVAAAASPVLPATAPSIHLPPLLTDAFASGVPTSSRSDTFLTGVDIDEASLKGGANVIAEPTTTDMAPVAPPALPVPAPIRTNSSFTTSVRQVPNLVVTSRTSQSASDPGTSSECIGKAADRTWFALPSRQRFVVSGDPVPWRNVRTRPLLSTEGGVPNRRGDPRAGGAGSAGVAAAFVPTGKPSSGALFPASGLPPEGPGSLPVAHRNSARSRRSSGSRPGSGRQRETHFDPQFGLEIMAMAPPQHSEPDGVTDSSTLQELPGFAQTASLTTTTTLSVLTTDEPEVDEDGVYTVPVPGAGRVYASTHGPLPNVDLLKDFAELMRRRGRRNFSPGSSQASQVSQDGLGAPRAPSTLAQSGKRSLQQLPT